MGGSKNKGLLLGGSYDKDHSIWGLFWGPPCLETPESLMRRFTVVPFGICIVPSGSLDFYYGAQKGTRLKGPSKHGDNSRQGARHDNVHGQELAGEVFVGSCLTSVIPCWLDSVYGFKRE